MPKKQKLINFKKDVDFKRDLQAGELLETSIIFVDDTKKIYTHNTEFDCSGGGGVSDWNDLENKPFGDGISGLLYSRDNVEFNGGTNGDFYLSTPDPDTVCPIDPGKTYRLILDDKSYDLVCKQGSIDNAYLFLTDGNLSSEWLIPNGGTIFFRCGADDGLNGVLGKLSDDQPEDINKVEIYELVVCKLDPKFLPIVQSSGESKTSVMSQLAVTRELENITFESNDNNGTSLKNARNNNTGLYSVAEGYYNTVSGNYAHAEGYYNTVSGNYAHVEGYYSKANGIYAHAEGNNSQATGQNSHAEGYFTEATKHYAHAEGDSTQAKGNTSHAEGEGTIANNTAEHASGKYNISNSDTIFSVGNGDNEESRHNAFEIKKNGDIYFPNTSATGTTSEKPMLKLQDMVIKKWEGTQAEYDAIATKDPETFYFIKEG